MCPMVQYVSPHINYLPTTLCPSLLGGADGLNRMMECLNHRNESLDSHTESLNRGTSQ